MPTGYEYTHCLYYLLKGFALVGAGEGRRVMLLFMSWCLLAGLLPIAHGATLDWAGDPEEKVVISQCEDVTFRFLGTHNLLQFSKKGRAKKCDFSDATLMQPVVTNGDFALSGNNFVKRKKHYFGCDHNNHCDVINQKTQVEVVPDFVKTIDQPCSGSLEPLKSFPLTDIASCESVCVQKDDCLGFSFDTDEAKACILYDSVPVPSGQSKTGSACYAARTSCPPATAPHCNVDAEVTCTLRDDPSKECSEYAKSFPTEIPENALGCQVYVKYDFSLTARTTEPSTWTWASRTLKGSQPEATARPPVYSWLDEGDISPAKIPGPGTAPFKSSETVLVDFCKKGNYKTLLEGVVTSNSNTICTDRKQYKLKVSGSTVVQNPTPAPPSPGQGPVTDDPCGFEEPKVGCVISEGQAGLPSTWGSATDCNNYVPTKEADCRKQIRYTYYVKHGAEPAGSKLINALRYRDGSYWEINPPEDPHGNPRRYSQSKEGNVITTGGPNSFYELDTWEGESVDFCKATSVETRFEFNTDGAGLYDCAKVGTYTLVTKDVDAVPPAPTPRPPGEPVCTLDVALECKIGNTTIPCEDYEPSTAAECSRPATYIHTLYNNAPFNSGRDLEVTAITRNRPGDVPHGDNFDLRADVYGQDNLSLPASFRATIRESPMINFCTDKKIYVTTLRVTSTPVDVDTQCNDEVTYTLDLSA